MGQLQSCMQCLSTHGGSNNYSFQAFKKVPFFGSLSNYLSFINGGSGPQGSAMFKQVTQMISNQWGGAAGMLPSMPFSPSSLIPSPGGSGMIDNIFKIANLLPVNVADPKNTSIFDLVKDDTFVRKIKKSNYKETQKKLQLTGQKFTDPDFPPNKVSLGNLDAHGTSVSSVQWKRMTEIIPNAVLCHEKFQPNDILQGQLGDCYFLSALAALAQQGYRIKSLFPSLQVSKQGIYMVRILHNGEYQQVVVDDYVPVDATGNVLFAQPAAGQQLWVMILQKCWAKLYGSYANIIGGLPNEVLHAFSGAPVFFHPIPSTPDKQNVLWERMVADNNAGALLCCGTKSQARIEEHGFVKGHAYTILGVYEKPFKMIKLRNPWGHKEWTGRASDHDLDFWNQICASDKQMLQYEDNNKNKLKDGVFFMVWQDFLEYFQLVDICKLNDNATYNFIPTQLGHLDAKQFEFQVKGEPSLVTIAVTQPDKRGTTQKGYSRNFAALGRWDPQSNSYHYVQSKSSKNFADNFLEVPNAQPGKYLLSTKYFWSEGRKKGNAVVNVYSLSPVQIKQTKQIPHQKFLSQIFYDHAFKNPRKKTLSGPYDWVCSDVLLNEGGYSYFVANVDKTSKAKLGVTLHENEYLEKRLMLNTPHKGCNTLKEEVKAGKPLIVVAQLLNEAFPSSITNPTPSVVPLE